MKIVAYLTAAVFFGLSASLLHAHNVFKCLELLIFITNYTGYLYHTSKGLLFRWKLVNRTKKIQLSTDSQIN